MKLVRYGRPGAEKPGVIGADGKLRALSSVVDDITPDVLSPASLKRLGRLDLARLPAVGGHPRLGCPLAGIGKMVCIGLNYTDHAAEVGLALPKEPTFFIKANSAICGPDDPMVRPRDAVKLDYEVELAAVIGRDARYVDEAARSTTWRLLHRQRRVGARLSDGARGHDDEGQERRHLRSRRALAGDGRRGGRPAGPRRLDQRQWRAQAGRQYGQHGVHGAPARGLCQPVHGPRGRRPDLDGHARGRRPRHKPPVYLEPGDVVEMGITGLGVQRHTVVDWKAAGRR